jgi:hypothetical protein
MSLWMIFVENQMNPLKGQRCTLFHNIDKVFWPNDECNNPSQKEPISISKLKKEILHFTTRSLSLAGTFRELTAPKRQGRPAPQQYSC